MVLERRHKASDVLLYRARKLKNGNWLIENHHHTNMKRIKGVFTEKQFNRVRKLIQL